MRIVLDLQACQTSGSRNRGIGRYSMALAKAMIDQAGRHEILVALNGAMPDAIDSIRANLADHLPKERILVWPSLSRVTETATENEWRRLAAERIRETFLASLRPDIVHISSLFEGIDDDAVSTVSTLAPGTVNAVTLYDLIPLIYKDMYLPVGVIRDWYYRKLRWLRRSDCWLAISEHSRREAISLLDLPPEHVHAISTAIDPMFRKIEVNNKTELLNRYSLVHPFVMYTGGIDHRKNIEGLIEAYGKLPDHIRSGHQLAIICKVGDADRQRLNTLAQKMGLRKGELVLTGFVPDEDLLALYNLCRLFVFPSWHEGFGIPALEAMSCGAATIAANSSSLPEVVGRRDALFDPRSTGAITEMMSRALSDEGFLDDLRQYGVRRAKLFNWDACARRALAAFEDTHAARQIGTSHPVGAKRPRLAYISPMPPERSGIADFSAELLPELSQHYDTEIVVLQPEATDTSVHTIGPVRSVEWFQTHADRFDRILYHFGNSSFHSHMFDLLERWPGIVVLHDFYLSGVIAYDETTGGKFENWNRALYASHGYAGLIARKEIPDFSQIIFRFPCNLQVIEAASGFIVHSEHARRLAEEWYGKDTTREWIHVPLARSLPTGVDRQKAREQLGIDHNEHIVCSFGIQAVTKLGDRLIEAFVASRLSRSDRCRLVFVGDAPGDYGDRLHTMIRDARMGERIIVTGHVPMELYKTWLAAADVAVQLRTMSRGETSASVLDCMAYGLPTIVNANGSMAELPNDALTMLDNDFRTEDLTAALERLHDDPKERHRIGEAAARYIRERHTPRRVSRLYRDAIEQHAEQSRMACLRRLSESLVRIEASVAPTPEDWIDVAACIAAVLPPATGIRQILVDLSPTLRQHDGAALRPFVRTLLEGMLRSPPAGWRVEPVYLDTSGRLRYARSFTQDLIGIRIESLKDDPIDLRPGDILLDPDFASGLDHDREALNRTLRHRNIRTYLLLDEPDPARIDSRDDKIGRAASMADGLVCIPPEEADGLPEWLGRLSVKRRSPLKIGYLRRDAGIANSVLRTVTQGAWDAEWTPEETEEGRLPEAPRRTAMGE